MPSLVRGYGEGSYAFATCRIFGRTILSFARAAVRPLGTSSFGPPSLQMAPSKILMIPEPGWSLQPTDLEFRHLSQISNFD